MKLFKLSLCATILIGLFATPSLITASAQLSIVSVSTKSPKPLTPLTLTVTGLANGIPVSLLFSNKAGFSLSAMPIRLDTNGTAIVAVPLYVNPKTGAVTGGKVSLVIIQGGQVSAPVSLAIQNLPALGSYGAKPGEISHAFFLFQSILLAGQLNQLQAAQMLIPSVDTTQSQQTLSNLLRNAILARTDVDAIMKKNSVVFTNGYLTNGTPILFDKNALEMMDRILAVHLTGLASLIRTNNSSKVLPGFELVDHVASPSENLKFISTLIGKIGGVGEVVESAQDLAQSQTLFNQTLAVADGLNSLVSLGDLSETASGVSEKLGGSLAVVGTIEDVELMSIDLGFIIKESYFGNGNPDVLQAAYADINSLQTKTFIDSAQTALAAPGVYLVYLEEVGVAATAWQEAGGTVADVVSTGLTTYSIWSDASDTGDDMLETAVDIGGNINIFPSQYQGFAQLTGNVSGGAGSGDTAPESSLYLCCFGASDLGIQGICDANGDYDLLVPLGVSGTDYGNMTLSAGDFITGDFWDSATVDLTGLDTTAPVQIPPLIVTYALTVATAGTGNGSVSVDPPGPAYTNGAVVTLTAVPDAVSKFAGWSGDASGTDKTIKIKMDGNESVTATFNGKALDLSGSGGAVGDYLGTATGCDITDDLYLDSMVSFQISGGGTDGPITATVTAEVDDDAFGNVYDYSWQGDLTWNGSAFTGQLVSEYGTGVAEATVTVTINADGGYTLDSTVPFTLYVYNDDGCSTSTFTFDYQLNGVHLTSQ